MITKERREALMRRFSETVAAGGGGTMDVRDTEEETLVRFWAVTIMRETARKIDKTLYKDLLSNLATKEGGSAG